MSQPTIEDMLRRMHNRAHEVRRNTSNSSESAELLEWAANEISRNHKEMGELKDTISRFRLLLNSVYDKLERSNELLKQSLDAIKNRE